MIKRLIRKLFGKEEPAETEAAPAAEKNQAAEAPARAKRVRAAAKPPPGPARVGPEQHKIDPQLVSGNAVKVTSTLQDAGYSAYLVGGAVRDLALGVKPKDFDVATNATPEQIKSLFRRAHIIGRRFQLVHVVFGNDIIEVSTFRANQPNDAETDQHGRVLRDNVFGSEQDDAARRDFTVNALFYDPSTQMVVDYHNGVADLRAKTMRMIGEPEKRYREDPVRMLRAVRFASKLGFSIDEATSAPIPRLAALIENVPSARLFDEMLKLLFSGHALACLKQLREQGLHRGLLPLLDVALEQPMGERFITLALQSTDDRIRQGKPTSPSFLFACLLWHEVLKVWEENKARGEYPIPALGVAMDQVLEVQTKKLAIQRRYAADMREIWGLQPRLERRSGRMPYRLLEHLRFRAGYDFLLLRCAAGECGAELGEWWTEFIEADSAGREALMNKPKADVPTAAAAKRKRRRRKRPADETQSGSSDKDDTTPQREEEGEGE